MQFLKINGVVLLLRTRHNNRIRTPDLFLVLFSVFILSVATYYLIFFVKNEEFVDNSEIKKILKQTPYLWRKAFYNKTESVSQRIEDQRLWIQRISKTDYVKKSKPKKIFVQNGKGMYYYTNGQMKCPYAREFESKCIIEEDKLEKQNKRLWLPFKFIENWRYYGKDVVTGIRNWATWRMEPILPKNIKQILYILENPHTYTKVAHLGWNDALLASYMKGSDVPIPYYRWIKNSSAKALDSAVLEKLLSGKTHKVAALISNCNTRNKRMDYIKEMRKHIDIDIYGKCGRLSCNSTKRNGEGPGHECLAMLEKKYKFFLSFENGNCQDYITEKFFVNGLNYSMLPIVMGAEPSSYMLEGPPNSFILVNDFKSPKELARHLHYLNSNHTAYKEYFKWKGTGYTSSHAESLSDFFCRLCGMLYYGDFIPYPSWNNSEMMWQDANYCLPEGQWYWIE